MDANKADFAIRFMASRLGVSTSGFYEWRHRQLNPCQRRVADAALTETITEIWRQSRGTYGSPRVWAELRLGRDIRVSRKRVERLMRNAAIEGVYRRRKRGCTRRNPQAVPSDDLVERRFNVDAPDRLWVADITEHPTREGKVYLAAVLDAFSRRVIGWSIADHLRAELVVDALDNAVAESFFGTLQLELFDRQRWDNRRQLAQGIFEYIEAFYNPERRHSTIDYLSPIDYENRHTTTRAVA